MESAQSLFESAREAHEQGDTSLAYDLYTKAYQQAKQENIAVPGLLDHFAELCVAVEDKKLAKTLYKESISAEPSVCPQKYLSLAELEKGSVAADLYRTGIRLLSESMRSTGENEEGKSPASSIASAYAALAELYMTDLCDEEGAEEECERCVAQAIATDPKCVDGHQALANLRLIRARFAESRNSLNDVLVLLRSMEESAWPSPEFLAETARMLVELEAWENVEEVTAMGIKQSEECDLLYLSAFAKFKQGKKEECRDTLDLLREKLTDEPNPEIAEAASELLAQLGDAMDTD